MKTCAIVPHDAPGYDNAMEEIRSGSAGGRALAASRLRPSKAVRKQAIYFGLAQGLTLMEIAKLANCSENRAYELVNEAETSGRLEEFRTKLTDRAVGRLAAAMTVAIDRLKTECETAPEPEQRIAAAKAILDKLSTIRPAAQSPAAQVQANALNTLSTEALSTLVIAIQERRIELRSVEPERSILTDQSVMTDRSDTPA